MIITFIIHCQGYFGIWFGGSGLTITHLKSSRPKLEPQTLSPKPVRMHLKTEIPKIWYVFLGPYKEDSSILGSTLRSSYFGKLLNRKPTNCRLSSLRWSQTRFGPADSWFWGFSPTQSSGWTSQGIVGAQISYSLTSLKRLYRGL